MYNFPKLCTAHLGFFVSTEKWTFLGQVSYHRLPTKNKYLQWWHLGSAGFMQWSAKAVLNFYLFYEACVEWKKSDCWHRPYRELIFALPILHVRRCVSPCFLCHSSRSHRHYVVEAEFKTVGFLVRSSESLPQIIHSVDLSWLTVSINNSKGKKATLSMRSVGFPGRC